LDFERPRSSKPKLSAEQTETMMIFHSDKTIAIGERLKPPADMSLRNAALAPEIPALVDVAVIGAGVIGLAIAWRLVGRGLSVAVFDRGEAGSGTSFAATGMLAAAAEHEPGCEAFLALALDSQRQWPEFRAELEAETTASIDYRDEGTLVVALGRDEVERLRFRHEQQRREGLDTKWLNGLEVRGIEPGLRASVAAGIFCPSDHQVDPRRLVPALAAAFVSRGGFLFEGCPVTSLDMTGGRVSGVVTPAGRCQAQTVVAAAGVWSSDGILPPALDIPMRPLKGQALALRTSLQTGAPRHVIWTEQIHLAPKTDGQLIVGSTMEDAGFNPAITAGGVLALLEGVHRALPSSEEMEIEAVWSGFRPTTDDDAPIIGETSVPGLLLATGHHRNGILLAPVTAMAIEQLITTGAMSGPASHFGLQRFPGNSAATMQIAGARR
jgi:glycine oxidase